jgi:hypothetical protein
MLRSAPRPPTLTTAAPARLQAPKLTGVQIAKFVRWAASAHSWYKHLPLQGAAVFSFVLDLTVGMKRTPDGFVEQHEVPHTPSATAWATACSMRGMWRGVLARVRHAVWRVAA